jgi:hypothetical protein
MMLAPIFHGWQDFLKLSRHHYHGNQTDKQLGDDSVFDDLKISKKDYPQVPTTW